MAQGRSNAAIGGTLFISAGVVEKHVASIFAKLGLAPSDNGNRRVIAAISTWNPDSPPHGCLPPSAALLGAASSRTRRSSLCGRRGRGGDRVPL